MTADTKLLGRDPTPEMVEAGVESNPTEWNEGTDCIFPSDVAEAIYRAMWVAAPATVGEPVKFTYRNWRGEVAERRVQPISIRFGSTEWHPEPQWLLRALDLDKGEEREFTLKDIGAPPDVDTIRRQAREEAELGAWQPIETAPKDGRQYLVYQPPHKSGRTLLDARIVPHGMEGGVRETTHWRPLPAPPARTEEK